MWLVHKQLVALKKQDRKEPSKIKRELAEASWSNNEDTDNNNNSDINHVNMIKDLFPSSVRSATTTTTSSHIDHQVVQDQGFCNMFNGIDETTSAGYWAWPDQQQQHQSHHQFNWVYCPRRSSIIILINSIIILIWYHCYQKKIS